MRKLIFIAFFAMGCQNKYEKASKQVDFFAESLSRQVSEQGWFHQRHLTINDPWGNKFVAKYERNEKGDTEFLRVISGGEDGIASTSDDIRSHTYCLSHAEVLEEIARIKKETQIDDDFGLFIKKGIKKLEEKDD